MMNSHKTTSASRIGLLITSLWFSGLALAATPPAANSALDSPATQNASPPQRTHKKGRSTPNAQSTAATDSGTKPVPPQKRRSKTRSAKTKPGQTEPKLATPAATASLPSSGPHFTSAKASLQLTVNGKAIPYQRFFYTLLPKQQLRFALGNNNDPYELSINGQILKEEHRTWQWQAPDKPGQYQLQLVEQLTHKTLTLALFVLTPMKGKAQAINGFQIGRYPPAKDGKKEYEPPKGFIEVTTKNAGYYVSPHFQLAQFTCKQKCTLPAYVALEPDLIEKLELLLELVNERGKRLDGFEVMSGFRTPYYNKSIRNVTNSRHIYGSAADIFIDISPKDGVMDDLNGDRKYDKQDAAMLYDLADQISTRHPNLAGGVGQYSATSDHGPFVHVDVRGSQARWGK